MLVQRDHIKAVTAPVAILLPCGLGEGDGLATFQKQFAAPQSVKQVKRDDFVSRAGMGKVLATMSDDDREKFRAVADLTVALKRNDELAVARARAHVERAYALLEASDQRIGIVPARESDLEFGRVLIRLFGLEAGNERDAIRRWNGYAHDPKTEADYRWLLSQLMTEALSSVQVVLWWNEKEFRPALYCPDSQSALYTILLTQIAGGQGWGVCPFCGQPFIQKRPDQTYCTIEHREAHRVARWREKKRRKRQFARKPKRPSTGR